MSGVPDEDEGDEAHLRREAFAHFGLAYYFAECVFEGLVQVVATQGVGLTVGAIEERTKRLRAGTLGPLVNAAKESIPDEHHAELDRVVERRNDLAHGFWFAHDYQLGSVAGLKALIEGFSEDQKLFRKFSRLTDQLMMPELVRRGMTQQQWEESMRQARSSPPDRDPDRPLPKAGTQIRILRAWHVPPSGLVFEDEEGQCWEPCDVGLGWCAATPEAHWKLVFSELLPANVVARPKGVKPWDYTVEFSTGLQVRGSIDATSKLPTVRVVRPSAARKAQP